MGDRRVAADSFKGGCGRTRLSATYGVAPEGRRIEGEGETRLRNGGGKWEQYPNHLEIPHQATIRGRDKRGGGRDKKTVRCEKQERNGVLL